MNLHPDVLQADAGYGAKGNFGSDGASLAVNGFCIGTIKALGQHMALEHKREIQELLALCSDFH
jgi:riboflavin synthase alpha subunit